MYKCDIRHSVCIENRAALKTLRLDLKRNKAIRQLQATLYLSILISFSFALIFYAQRERERERVNSMYNLPQVVYLYNAGYIISSS